MEYYERNKTSCRGEPSTGCLSKFSFPVKSPNEYEGPFPSFREPTEVGCFSLDDRRRFHADNHQMKYLAMPPLISGLSMDLSEGYEKVVRKDQSNVERLDNILHWILSNKDKVIANFAKPGLPKNQSFGADFVCYRGLLTELVCTVYENKDDWLICATKFKGTIYLCAFPTDQKKAQNENQTARQLLMSSWGYKFEQYMTADVENGKPNTEVPVNENEEFCISVKGRLSNKTILYSAEVDCVSSLCEKDISTKHYVELKTSRVITTERQDWSFCRYKLIKWWAQSFLIGIPKVICGFRDDRGIVRNIRTFHTTQIPKMSEGLWSPSAGMNFCNVFLEFVKKVVVKDDSNVVYKFYRSPGRDIECEELASPGEYQILPGWYTSSFAK